MNKVTKNGQVYGKTILRSVKDRGVFRLNLRSTNVSYTMQSKKKGIATFTSNSSGLTLTRPLSTTAYIKC